MRNGNSAVAACAFVLAGISWGHIDNLKINGLVVATANSSPLRDTPYAVGQVVTVTFDVDNAHGGTAPYILHLSRNGGTTWDSVGGLPGSTQTGEKTLQWTVPGPTTAQAKVRLYQRLAGQAVSNTSNNYNLVSAAFQITPGTPVLPFAGEKILSFRQAAGAIHLNLEGNGFRVAEISNLNGVVMRTLNIPYGSGMREFVFPTAGLPLGKAVFRLLADGQPAQNRVIVVRR